tara:strand:+ start:1784 stop:1927 length:144 start_codon:yes stop_codon:yes gene_type:complete
MEILKAPREYAKEVKELGFTKEEFCEVLTSNEPKLPVKYILDCLHAY